MAELDSDNCER